MIKKAIIIAAGALGAEASTAITCEQISTKAGIIIQANEEELLATVQSEIVDKAIWDSSLKKLTDEFAALEVTEECQAQINGLLKAELDKTKLLLAPKVFGFETERFKTCLITFTDEHSSKVFADMFAELRRDVEPSDGMPTDKIDEVAAEWRRRAGLVESGDSKPARLQKTLLDALKRIKEMAQSACNERVTEEEVDILSENIKKEIIEKELCDRYERASKAGDCLNIALDVFNGAFTPMFTERKKAIAWTVDFRARVDGFKSRLAGLTDENSKALEDDWKIIDRSFRDMGDSMIPQNEFADLVKLVQSTEEELKRALLVMSTAKLPNVGLDEIRLADEEIDWEGAQQLQEALTGPIPEIQELTPDEKQSCPGTKPVVLQGEKVTFLEETRYWIRRERYSSEPARKYKAIVVGEPSRAMLVDAVLKSKGMRTLFVTPEPDETRARCLSHLSFEKNLLDIQDLFQKDYYPLQVEKYAQFAKEGIELFKALHHLGFVHGGSFITDIRFVSNELDPMGGIAFVGTDKITEFVDPESRTSKLNKCEKIERIWHYYRWSPGELRGYCTTRADDMYRFAEALFKLIGSSLTARATKEQAHLYSENKVPRTALIEEKETWTLLAKQEYMEKLKVFNDFKQAMFEMSNSLKLTRPDYEHWIARFDAIAKA